MVYNFKGVYRYMFIELADPRNNHLLFVRSPFPGLCIIIPYVIFVLYLGPKLMKNREPFKLQALLVIYNALQIIINAGLLYPAVRYAYPTYNWLCEPVDRSRSPEAMKIAYCTYWYLISRFFDLLDTVFFVLRKKDNQITFLHMQHHTGMPLLCWGASKYYPGGTMFLGGSINCWVHIVMYAYYMISAMGPKYHKYLWWKKYITLLQLIQFFIGAVMAIGIFAFDCGFPRWVLIIALPNIIWIFFMFTNFYKETYRRTQQKINVLLSKRTNDEPNNNNENTDV